MKTIAGQFLGSAVTLYFVFTAFPFPVDLLPKSDKITGKYWLIWSKLLEHVAPKVLKLLKKPPELGSNEDFRAYLRYLIMAALAASLAALICATARRASIADWLKRWGGLYLRCYLSFGMLWFAAIKIVRQQFPFPPLERFVTTYGTTSPAGLLWTFMGYSHGYTLMAGLLELLGAMLLLFRRTAPAGALVLIVVLSQVVAVDVFYDVQDIRLYAIHLLALAIYFLWPSLGRLAEVLLLDRDSQAPLRYVSAQTLRRERIITAITVLCAAGLFAERIHHARAFVAQRGFEKSIPDWWGIYEVGDVAKNGVSVKPADPLHWTSLIIDRGPGDSDVLEVRNGSAPWTRYQIRKAPSGGFALSTEQGPAGHLTFTGAQDEFVEAHGELFNSPLVVELRRMDPAQLKLLNGGIHWIHKPAAAKPAP